jgi:hypothetical protein
MSSNARIRVKNADKIRVKGVSARLGASELHDCTQSSEHGISKPTLSQVKKEKHDAFGSAPSLISLSSIIDRDGDVTATGIDPMKMGLGVCR